MAQTEFNSHLSTVKLHTIDMSTVLIWLCLIAVKRVIASSLICETRVRICEECVEKPLYLLIAEWMMAENRWVIAGRISIHFNTEYSRVVNTLTYTLSEVTEISCEVKMIPNKLEGWGYQCQRLVKAVDIDEQIYARLRNNSRDKLIGVKKTPRIPAVPLTELNRERKWQMMLPKSMRR